MLWGKLKTSIMISWSCKNLFFPTNTKNRILLSVTSSGQSNEQFPQSPPWLPSSLATLHFRLGATNCGWHWQPVRSLLHITQSRCKLAASLIQSYSLQRLQVQHAGSWTERYRLCRLHLPVKDEGFCKQFILIDAEKDLPHSPPIIFSCPWLGEGDCRFDAV